MTHDERVIWSPKAAPMSTAVMHARVKIMCRAAELIPTHGVLGVEAFLEGAISALGWNHSYDHAAQLITMLRADVVKLRDGRPT